MQCIRYIRPYVRLLLISEKLKNSFDFFSIFSQINENDERKVYTQSKGPCLEYRTGFFLFKTLFKSGVGGGGGCIAMIFQYCQNIDLDPLYKYFQELADNVCDFFSFTQVSYVVHFTWLYVHVQ